MHSMISIGSVPRCTTAPITCAQREIKSINFKSIALIGQQVDRTSSQGIVAPQMYRMTTSFPNQPRFGVPWGGMVGNAESQLGGGGEGGDRDDAGVAEFSEHSHLANEVGAHGLVLEPCLQRPFALRPLRRLLGREAMFTIPQVAYSHTSRSQPLLRASSPKVGVYFTQQGFSAPAWPSDLVRGGNQASEGRAY